MYIGRVVQLGFKVGYDTTYSFTANGLNSFNPEVKVFLEDKYSHNDRLINLKLNPVYSFVASTDDDPERFCLHYFFGWEDYDDLSNSNDFINIYSYGKIIYITIKNPENFNGRALVYNTLGGIEKECRLGNRQLNTISMAQKNGYYIVNVINNTYFCTGKVYIR
ncbi:MAG: hypothetical protein K8R53_01675 [Bacteroidales bacterium]|nr:hypothetical protein [Bacteroidales bacterium]